MREWLDRHNRPLVRFETEAAAGTITVKVQFDSDDLAELFRTGDRGRARRCCCVRTSRVNHC